MTNSQGEWQLELPADLAVGLHQIVASEPGGQEDTAIIYIEQPEPYDRTGTALIENFRAQSSIQYLLPPPFAYTVFIFLLIIIALAFNLVRLGNKIDEEMAKRRLTAEDRARTEKYRREHAYLRQATVFAVVAIIFSFLVGIWLNLKTLPARPSPTPQMSETLLFSVSGTIVTPFDEVGVAGVDVSAGETSIRTDVGGSYRFDGVKIIDGLRLNHPLLSRSIVKVFEDVTDVRGQEIRLFPVKIYFDPAMYNLLAAVVDLEARGRYGDIYDYLPALIKAKMSREEFAGRHLSIFTPENIADQYLFLSNTRAINYWDSSLGFKLERVVSVKVLANGRETIYYLQQTETGWQLVI